ncbi:ATP-dependent helicase, partial [archaeon]|nr:ATP-dependent helicase [archaeon]
MISHLEKPHKKEDLLSVLHPYVKEWFFKTFKEFSLPQLYGVLEIHNKNNILISAPTGGTKTLTSTLAIINELVILADKKQLKDKVYCIYCNPLRALSRDIEFNLQKPLEEIKKIAKKHGKDLEIR